MIRQGSDQSKAIDLAVGHGPKPASAARTLVITGRVQGVGFRAWMTKMARELALNGWVRNRKDGSVEAHVQGATMALDFLADRCRRGPAHAQVEHIYATTAKWEKLDGFTQQATV